ncbi:nitroreductase family protein [Cellvibrio mixtus]|uniref:nitroreductase family protein n=1 Tax=Cellvibrio mixtus TaxID=39650 RepID=UPI0005880809|nr:nitroreductase [Cellvibrio mixtus]
MDALVALHQRVSITKLMEPAPDKAQLDQLFKAALRAADHGNMRPWRFLVIEKGGLVKLGALFARVAQANKPEITEPELERFKSMPLRAPMIIACIAKTQDNPKVPLIEQIIAAGAATQNLITAAFALGLGAVWRTGDMAYDPQIKTALGLATNEELVGYVYIGTPSIPVHLPREQKPEDFFSYWSPE